MGVKNWKRNGENQDAAYDEIMRVVLLPRPIGLFFASRGISADKIRDFLEPKLDKLTDPYRFPGIEKAAARLWQAIKNHEPILIHGDYDTDGITASALLEGVLRSNGATVNSFIPHRFDDGYGFTPESLDKALEMFGNCGVLVTVDCGITSVEAVNIAVERGIDVIVTDHHEVGPELPTALAVINPKICEELQDLQALSGVGISFKLSHAFIKYGREKNLGGFNIDLREALDYVALGTVADIVPLLGENRVMVKYGIEVLRRQMRPGVRALIESCQLHTEISPTDITFRLAPRINAAGRVGDAGIALKLLKAEGIVEAYDCASKLESYNRIRQEKEQEIYQEAKKQIDDGLAWQSPYSLLVAGRDWHQGVIGIVASRLARDYNRPTIVLTVQGEVAYGSGRSITGLNLVGVLTKLSGLLERFGGHPMAIGVGLKTENISTFYHSMDAEIRAQLSADDLVEYITYDGDCCIGEMNSEFFEFMDKLSPFGHSNAKPVFRFNEMRVLRCCGVGGGNHTRGMLQDGSGMIDFIAFNMQPNRFYGKVVDVLATPQINQRQNGSAPQLNIVDIRDSY